MMHMAAGAGRTFGAVGLAVGGLLANGVGHLLAAGPPTSVDYVTGIGSVSAAGALVYIVKQMVDGKLVARDPARVEALQAEQNQRLSNLLSEAHQREADLRGLYQSAITKGQP